MITLSINDFFHYLIYIGIIVLLVFAIILIAKLIGIASDVKKTTKIVAKHSQILDKKLLNLYKTIDKIINFFPDIVKKIKKFFDDRKKKKQEKKDSEKKAKEEATQTTE